ncbi:MAG: hypothetical protein AUJ72_03750 [Candidatus Omnitrophica bacterium CG1_02_46_14]|nr:MAG: hypothetical protein AUJ72_03750 [Candidatus Omnitrophica bacterium CG1_02_46_14]
MNLKKILTNAGQSTVEFAFMSIFFFIFVIGLFDMARICYYWVSLQYIVTETARDRSLGNDTTALRTADRIAGALGIDPMDVTITPFGNNNNFVQVQVKSKIELNPVSSVVGEIVGHNGIMYDVFAQTVIRNEPLN